jgi:protein phosphatase
MLRVAEQYTGTDTGRQRRANEDALLARAPLYVVADGMGGAQAGEVASRIAVEVFQPGLRDAAEPERALAALALLANERIHELSHSNAEQAGMGTTLTAVYVGEHEVAIAHVGDSRAYCLREGELLRLTDDHTLVDELLRQGRLTPEEAVEHPQRSVITRALGPEGAVEVDTRTFQARAGDVYLLCSDGLTTMLSEPEILELLLAHPPLHDAGEALIAAANAAGGRDNVTVVLLRLEDVDTSNALSHRPAREQDTVIGLPVVRTGEEPAGERAPGRGGADNGRPRTAAQASERPTSVRRAPRPARPRAAPARRRRWRVLRHARSLGFSLVMIALLACAAWLALTNIYFVGTDGRGLVTLYQGVPYQLPGNIDLYSRQYVSGVDASKLSPRRRKALLDHSLRTEHNAGSVIHGLELEQLE